MWVQSEGIGKGSTFAFTVPLVGLRKIMGQLMSRGDDRSLVPPAE